MTSFILFLKGALSVQLAGGLLTVVTAAGVSYFTVSGLVDSQVNATAPSSQQGNASDPTVDYGQFVK